MLIRRNRPWTNKPEENQGRTGLGNKFYQTPVWKMLRKQKSKEIPYCQACKKEDIITRARVCDHIRPRRLFPALETSYSNLQMLCNPCHNSKSGKEQKAATPLQWDIIAKREGWI